MEKFNISNDITIIGAGLTGLTLAYLLKDSNLDVHVIEARNRLGGRILTEGYEDNRPIELGATWLGDQHSQFKDVLRELELETFDQKIGNSAIYEAISTRPPYLATLPPNPHPSMRLKGGSAKVIYALAARLKSENIILQQPVLSISQMEESVNIESKDYRFTSKTIVSTLPPNLLVNSIDISPRLPNAIVNLCQATHTWMGESIKIILTYPKPFWRSSQLSGTIMSNVGPIGEMYDHSNYEESFFALKGFFSGNYFSISKEERLSMIMRQLKKYFGSKAENYLTYEEKVWRNESYTFAPYTDHVLPHQNNGHQLFQESHLNGKLLIGGTETAQNYPGYMEGAIDSAQRLATKILFDYNPPTELNNSSIK